jgi:hypothetical protein
LPSTTATPLIISARVTVIAASAAESVPMSTQTASATISTTFRVNMSIPFSDEKVMN